jgi:membrane protein
VQLLFRIIFTTCKFCYKLTRLEFHIIKSKPIQAIIFWLKGVFLPGFEGVSLFDSLNFFRKQIFQSRFNSRANAVSFSFLMALPPLLLFFFTLIPYLPLPEAKILTVLNDMLKLLAPGDKMQKSISKIIADFISHKKTVLLSFSVLLTIFYSSNGMMALMKSFEKQLPGFKKRAGVKQRLLAIVLTFLLITSLLLTLIFMILQAWLAKGLHLDFLSNSFALKSFAYFIIVGMCFLIVSILYRYGPSTYYRIRLISPGSIIATFLIVMLTLLFFYAVNNLVNYNKIYGSIGTLIIFLIWINFMAQILLIGFELNVSIIVNRKNVKDEDEAIEAA